MKQPIRHTIRSGDNLYQISRYYNTTIQSILSYNPNINPYNLIIGTSIIICPEDNFDMYSGNQAQYAELIPSMQNSLKDDMREAWVQHVYWTRMLLISIAQRLEDQNSVTDRLMENPKDIADIFANYYDTEAVNNIERLLTEHLQIGADLITALRDKKTIEAKNLNKLWHLNADRMATAFSMINPYFDRNELWKMLRSHLDLTTLEVAMRLAGNYPADIEAFNQVEQEALSMADYFTSGIMQQFPQMFYQE